MRTAPRIAVVGSYGAGLSFELERMPRAGETVPGRGFRVDAGGKGSNQAIGAARLGAEVSLLTAIGSDSFGASARELWRTQGVDDASVVTVSESPTMVAAILVEPDGENRIVIARGALEHLRPHHVEAFAGQIGQADVCLVQLEIPLETAETALRLARRHGVRSVLNPAPAPDDGGEMLVALADYVTPNRPEAERLSGERGLPPAHLAEALRAMGPTPVVTLGPEGAFVLGDNGGELVPALSVGPAVDTTGAGDAFNAAFAVALAEGSSPVVACRWGCAAGGLNVLVPGVVPGLPSRNELQRRGAANLAANGGD